MKKIESVKSAFEQEGLNVDEIKIEGFPEHHIEALIALGKLMVVHDQVNPEFEVDYENSDQMKYEPYFYLPAGFASGVGFRLSAVAFYWTHSSVGARLVSESDEAARYIATHPEFKELYNKFLSYKRPIKKK